MPPPRLALPLRLKLPLLVCGLLLGVTVLQTAASYGEIRTSAEAVGRDRLRAVADQLAGMLATSVANSQRTLVAAAGDSAIARYLRAPSAAGRGSAIAAMRRPPGAQRIAIELWSARREFLLSTVANAARPFSDPLPELTAAAADPGRLAVGRLRSVHDSVVIPVALVVQGPGGVLGYYVVWSRIAGTPESRDPLLRLIGQGSALMVGNDDGSLWTDLTSPVPAPPAVVRTSGDVVTYARQTGQEVYGRARAIAGTPWYVLIEFPTDVVLAGTTRFLVRAAIVGFALLLIGFILAWSFTQGITRQIGRLGDAAAAVTTGDYAPVTGLDRPDELGALATAFNTMAARVRDTETALEDRVRERTRKLEERNEELEAFGYTVAHDLRAPIRAMHGFATALLEDYGARFDDNARDYTSRIVVSATRMDALVRDLLEYSQVAREEISLAPVDLTRAVQGALAAVQDDISSTHAAVTVYRPFPTVMAHEPTLTRVVVNLVSNALKFVAPGRAPTVRIRSNRQDGVVRLWVEDDGVGIPPDQHDFIFRVFERLHRRDEYPGTGIGLAIVRKGVERMGGRSGVESTPGRGSRFWVELPVPGVNA